MADSILFSINAVFPIVLVAAFGFFCRKNSTLTDEFLKTGNKFCFKYCFFAMMFCNVYKIDSLAEIRWNSIVTALIIVLLLFVAGLAFVVSFVKDKRQKGVILQAIFRSNFAIIGIPLASNIFGDEGQQAAALISAFSVPMFNVLAVVSLVLFTRDEKSSAKAQVVSIIKKILTNPLILGTACGMACLAVRPYCGEWRLSTGNLRFIYKAVDSLAVIAPWLSLIILGGSFRFSAIKRLLPQISVAVAARLLFAPAVGMTLSYFLPRWLNLAPLSGADYAALFALFGSPVAIASVAMADQMGSDSELAGQILVWTTLFSAFTVFAQTALLRHIGLF